uniref:Plant heme peroxidase family profile domain-containing protein n=1 Tax=Oryza glaberrima TaxID=4538 RepID=I1QS61_ORYGL
RARATHTRRRSIDTVVLKPILSCAPCMLHALQNIISKSGGPGWGVLLGRLDGKTSDFNGSLNLPAPTDNLTVLRQKFAALNLNDVDLVALSGTRITSPANSISVLPSCPPELTTTTIMRNAGGHTFGRVQCQFVTDRLYNFSNTGRPDPTMDAAYRSFLSQRCPPNGPPAALNDLDPTTPDTFDNHYYTNIEVNRGFLQSDQELKSAPEATGTTAPIVDRFATSQAAFFRSFAQSMINMGNLSPVTDPSLGEVRTNCRRVN